MAMRPDRKAKLDAAAASSRLRQQETKLADEVAALDQRRQKQVANQIAIINGLRDQLMMIRSVVNDDFHWPGILPGTTVGDTREELKRLVG